MNNTAKEGITDASKLGIPKYIILGVQHLFAMFGATILVPILTGLSVSSTQLFAGIGTLFFLRRCCMDRNAIQQEYNRPGCL